MSDIKRGLTLGKYAPLHRGHQLVIETGLHETDEMIVLIYDSPDVTDIPLAVRSNWIRSLYPTVRVIEAWGGPSEVGYTPEVMRSHERYVTDILGGDEVTHFYSSEVYGAHMSQALNACDRRVDMARESVPVCGEQVRKDPYAHRQFLHPMVYSDLVTKVVFLGAPCTGKSTIAASLARAFGTKWMPEFGREYWEVNHVNRRLAPDQLLDIAKGHIARENRLLGYARDYLFIDTNATSTETFARYYHGQTEPRLSALVDAAVTRYDLVFLCDTDIPYDDTRDRSGEGNREVFQRQVKSDLIRRQVPFISLSGSIEERVSFVQNLLRRFTKYSNLIDLFDSTVP